MDDFTRLGNELRADFAMLEARQGDMARQFERMIASSEASAEAARLAAEAARQAAETATVTGREARDHFSWTEGRMRLMNERFDAFLALIEKGQDQVQLDIADLKSRVTRLEERPPAA